MEGGGVTEGQSRPVELMEGGGVTEGQSRPVELMEAGGVTEGQSVVYFGFQMGRGSVSKEKTVLLVVAHANEVVRY